MTERLYYTDPALVEFDATILDSGPFRDKFYAILDKSAFYPTSGGQPHDLGLLNNSNVLDVMEDENGAIRHIIDQPTGENGAKIHGIVDSNRRKYFRQLHTAQHILSRTFIDLFGMETVSVHLGLEYGAIELPVDAVSAEQCTNAEQFAFKVIQENQPIEIIFADETKAAVLPLRKKPDRPGIIRIIKIGELDWSACGGTHCSSTAEVCLMKVIAVEKQRRNSLVKFLAGTKAKVDYDMRFKITDEISKGLTCSVADIPGRIEKLNEENKNMRKQLSALQQQLLPSIIESFISKSVQEKKVKIVCEVITDIDSKMLNQLAGDVAKKIDGLAALLFENRMCLAVSDNSKLDAGQIVKELSTRLNLKGGGSKAIAQLGGVQPDRINEYREVLAAVINEM